MTRGIGRGDGEGPRGVVKRPGDGSVRPPDIGADEADGEVGVPFTDFFEEPYPGYVGSRQSLAPSPTDLRAARARRSTPVDPDAIMMSWLTNLATIARMMAVPTAAESADDSISVSVCFDPRTGFLPTHEGRPVTTIKVTLRRLGDAITLVLRGEDIPPTLDPVVSMAIQSLNGTTIPRPPITDPRGGIDVTSRHEGTGEVRTVAETSALLVGGRDIDVTEAATRLGLDPVRGGLRTAGLEEARILELRVPDRARETARTVGKTGLRVDLRTRGE